MKFFENIRGEHILFSVLNWGLGHATRSAAIIKQLLENQNEVVIASDGYAGEWLKKHFPQLTYEELPAYRVIYPKQPQLFKLFLANSWSAWINASFKEIKTIQRLHKRYRFSMLFSDNRPHSFLPSIPSFYITHQIKVFSGVTTPVTTLIHQKLMEKFERILVPDFPGKFNLAGELSHPKKISKKVLKRIQYIGPLSRFTNTDMKKKNFYPYKWFISISGPEHQRTVFEKIIAGQHEIFGDRVALIRGTMKKKSVSFPSSWDVIDLADTPTMEYFISHSERIISRSGYSSVMDWYVLGKPALLVPTPGQFEQDYLAKHLNNNKLFPCVKQKLLPKLGQEELNEFFEFQPQNRNI